MSDLSARLIHEFTYHSIVSAPHEVGVGPLGHRQYYEVTKDVLEGPRLRGKQLGAGGDWMLIGSDGFMRMNVRVQIETEDGAIVCAAYSGPAEANEKLAEGLAASTPTAFSDQSIRTHWLLETGRPPLRLGQPDGLHRRGAASAGKPRGSGVRASCLSPRLRRPTHLLIREPVPKTNVRRARRPKPAAAADERKTLIKWRSSPWPSAMS